MDQNKRRSSLGRGLNALFGETAPEDFEPLKKGETPRHLPIEFVTPGRFQPRRKFDQEAIQSLVDSVKERGILQPLLVRQHPDDGAIFEIIAGERRWRAAQLAGLHQVPVVIRELSDREALEIALIENIQRQDLTALEEAEGYKRLMDEFGHTQEVLAKALGKSRSHIANMLRLLTLPLQVKQMVQEGSLTAGHARALLSVEDPVATAQQVIERGLNVRQVEQLAREAHGNTREDPVAPTADAPPIGPGPVARAGSAPVVASRTAKDPDTIALEQDVTNRLGLRVSISSQGQGGTLSIQYQTLDQLDEVIERLTGRAS
ncbi:chromosome partitioning protein ParB [Skermanella aerolata]|uniref:Chromosome partitioning protein ParB n=1 Tax=Skermanella aerolata TaxID=393310 RepID=A0A512DNY0_9PROT|nr:ParB/RepB/Spo0J family partition protein [Skermanella aerolata]KJB95815.1 chromosome partitioning protein ParB [Skermanella aerolata KACC 11604]GEO38167.1 chromosome partitioning protein ParB [Skermanella aerolata]